MKQASAAGRKREIMDASPLVGPVGSGLPCKRGTTCSLVEQDTSHPADYILKTPQQKPGIPPSRPARALSKKSQRRG
jgi:hypothetical protein